CAKRCTSKPLPMRRFMPCPRLLVHSILSSLHRVRLNRIACKQAPTGGTAQSRRGSPASRLLPAEPHRAGGGRLQASSYAASFYSFLAGSEQEFREAQILRARKFDVVR